ncbi:hypothetical protein A1O7_05813 [Cladophialophora yegresii CBS 114405]|uniref:Uncharacterized protein n=1 Tax=Cladophialophora yegresii CBS 114405 TaxID=1182544 RepID=W9VS72_9EURO|nr:uncharacterized protein A1O7_05813 [Cladophialophora yegresii CBS 114405]EXJ58388.1 hypothetical protein A1O7_05813 [Cladophialophora yegresii CBS 114405]
MSAYVDQVYREKGGVRWLLTDEERKHIVELLDTNESTVSHLKGTNMTIARMTCVKCGKRSGLDDLVHNAVEGGIHNKEFMVDVLVNGPKGASPLHHLDCSRCSERFKQMCTWHNDEDCGSWD